FKVLCLVPSSSSFTSFPLDKSSVATASTFIATLTTPNSTSHLRPSPQPLTPLSPSALLILNLGCKIFFSYSTGIILKYSLSALNTSPTQPRLSPSTLTAPPSPPPPRSVTLVSSYIPPSL